MRFVAITYCKSTQLEVTFGGQHEQRPQELIDVDEFIGVKSHRAKGKRITTYDVSSLRFIEPELPEEDDAMLEGDGEDMVEELDMIDADAIMGEELKATPGVDYSSKPEADNVGFEPSQLDLF